MIRNNRIERVSQLQQQLHLIMDLLRNREEGPNILLVEKRITQLGKRLQQVEETLQNERSLSDPIWTNLILSP